MSFDNQEVKDALSVLMKSAQKMMEGKEHLKGDYESMLRAQKEKTIESSSGAGRVKIIMNLGFELKSLEIAPSCYEEDPAVLTDLIKSALQQALVDVKKQSQSGFSDLAKQMGMPTPTGA